NAGPEAQNDGAITGSSESRVDDGGASEEETVTSHRERHTGAREDRTVQRGEDGDEHCNCDRCCSSAAVDAGHHVGGDATAFRDGGRSQDIEVSHVDEDVGGDNGERSKDERAWEGARMLA